MTLASSVEAGVWDVSGQVSPEARYFPTNVAYPTQKNVSLSTSLSGSVDVVYDTDSGNDRFVFVPYARVDADDDNRTHQDVHELNWLHLGNAWDLTVGVAKVYWGVTESAHLVDIINQTDNVEDITGEEKLGQPMVNLNVEQDWGTLNFFVLPGFRERNFSANDARLHGPLSINNDQATYESSRGTKHVDLAVRWSHTLDDLDIAISQFQGTSREAQLSGSQVILVPHYQQISQTGIELQLTTDNTLWKFEGISRSGQGNRFYGVVGGFEHTLYSVAQSNVDVGLLMEYLYDNRDPTTAQPSIANHDVFAGFRVAMNDTQDTTMLVGGLMDYKDHSVFMNIEAERRLTDRLKAELAGRFLTNVATTDPLYLYRNDDFISVKLNYYF
ncbi:MAG: hypothetical protein R8M14_02140 [Ghiorsea sp.]